MLVQAFVPQPAVEAFHEGVLNRLAGFDVVPGHPTRNPPQNGDTIVTVGWKRRNGGMEASDANRLKALEDGNRRLNKLLAESMRDNAVVKDIMGKNG
jgi:hypothetical protein